MANPVTQQFSFGIVTHIPEIAEIIIIQYTCLQYRWPNLNVIQMVSGGKQQNKIMLF